ncbi:DUF5753 domain-containing protein [Streptomyces sp. NPDC090053]|uniref:DUF5753 domain-containing protein n=1 Tax=Streptomyces sp. NPDC090053 TaxID=3365932 RepID=UPI0038031175
MELGLRLREIRESIFIHGRPMTRKQAVDGLRLNESMLGRIETGSAGFRVKGDLIKLLKDKYEIDDEEFIETLVKLNSDDRSSDDWVTRYRGYMSVGMTTFVGIEAEARVIKLYNPVNVHGLLQSERYARALYDIGKPIEETTSDFIRTHVALRMERKRRVLQRQPEPVRVRAILSEAAVRATVGSSEIMCEQWQELAMLSRLANVQIQVLPLEGQGTGYRSAHDFAILDLGEGLRPMVQVDTPWGAVSTSDKPHEFERFSRRWDEMSSYALAPEDTQDYVYQLARKLKSD